MKRYNSRLILFVCVLCLSAASSMAGERVWIRLVRTGKNGESDPALQDVAGALGKNFAFRGYRLNAQTTIPLPAGTTSRLGPYSIRCDGPQNALQIQVLSGGKTLLATTASLRDGKPLVLGGFPAVGGSLHILIFVAR